MTRLTAHDLSLDTLDELTSVDALALFVGEDERPLRGLAGYVDWRLCGGLSRVLKDNFFSGKLEDWLLLPSNGRVGPQRIFVLGVGEWAQATVASLSRALTVSARRLSLARVESVALEIPGPRLEEAERISLFQEKFLPEFRGDSVALLGDRSLRRYLPGPATGQAGA